MAISKPGLEPSSSQFAELPTSQYQNKQPQWEINQSEGRGTSAAPDGWAHEIALPHSSPLVTTNPDQAGASHREDIIPELPWKHCTSPSPTAQASQAVLQQQTFEGLQSTNTTSQQSLVCSSDTDHHLFPSLVPDTEVPSSQKVS